MIVFITLLLLFRHNNSESQKHTYQAYDKENMLKLYEKEM